MKLADKLNYLQKNHMSDWLTERRRQDDKLSDQQSMYCVCGRLATGLHESGCQRFKNKVNSETLKSLSHLLPAKNGGA